MYTNTRPEHFTLQEGSGTRPPPAPLDPIAKIRFGAGARGEPKKCNFRMRETRAVRVCIGSKRFPVPYTSVVSIIRQV